MNRTIVYSDPRVLWLSKHFLTHVKIQYRNSFSSVIFVQNHARREISLSMDFFYARPTSFAKSLFLQIVDEQRENWRMPADLALRRVLAANKYNDSRVGYLDLLLYPNEHMHTDSRVNKLTRIEPLIVNSGYAVQDLDKLTFIQEESGAISTQLASNAEFNKKFTASETSEIEIARLMDQNRIGNVTIVTSANNKSRDFVLNWILNLKGNDYTRFVVCSISWQARATSGMLSWCPTSGSTTM
jgi:hypothetical protein